MTTIYCEITGEYITLTEFENENYEIIQDEITEREANALCSAWDFVW